MKPYVDHEFRRGVLYLPRRGAGEPWALQDRYFLLFGKQQVHERLNHFFPPSSAEAADP